MWTNAAKAGGKVAQAAKSKTAQTVLKVSHTAYKSMAPQGF
jgi:hypothetical protein